MTCGWRLVISPTIPQAGRQKNFSATSNRVRSFFLDILVLRNIPH